MNRSLLKIVKWFCRQLTFNELASAVIIFLEVLNNSRKDIQLKPDDKPPHYREFRVDPIPPLPAIKVEESVDWEDLKAKKESQSGKPIKPVKGRKASPVRRRSRCRRVPGASLHTGGLL